MERLTRATVKVDETAAKYMAAPGSIPADLRIMNDRLLDLVINGPTLNGVNKDVLRQLIRQLYAALQPYEDTGLVPEEVERSKLTLMGKSLAEITEFDGVSIERLKELAIAEKEGRLVVLPCKVGDTAWVKDRAGVPREMRLETADIRFVCTDEDNLCMATCHRKPDGFCAYRIRNDGTDFGRTLFLTREEAERALEGQK